MYVDFLILKYIAVLLHIHPIQYPILETINGF